MQGESASSAQKKEGASIFQGWKKFLAPPNFVQQEEQLETMDPPSRYTFELMMSRLDALIAGTQNPDIRQQLNYTKADMLVEREKSKVSEDMIVDFIRWILGTSDKNVIFEEPPFNPNGVAPNLDTIHNHPIITPWGNKPYTFLPDVKDFLDGIVDERASVEKFIAKLKLHGPRNLPELWIYYKYIVLKQGLDGLVIEYARFLEPYMGPPPPKVPYNPTTGNDAYRYHSKQMAGEQSQYIGESQTVNEYDREGPNPPGYTQENAAELMRNFQAVFGDAILDYQNAVDDDAIIALAQGVRNAFMENIDKNAYAYPEDLRRQIDARMAADIASLPDSVFKAALVEMFGYGFDDNGLPTRVNATIGNAAVNALANQLQFGLTQGLQGIRNTMANNPALNNVIAPNNLLAGQLGTLGTQLQTLTDAINNLKLPAPAPAIRLQGGVPVIDIAGATVEVPNVGINLQAPTFVDPTGAIYDFTKTIKAPQRNITVPGQRVEVGAPTITQQPSTFVDSNGLPYDFSAVYNPIISVPATNVVVGKPVVNQLPGTVTYAPGYSHNVNYTPQVNIAAPGAINVQKPLINQTPVTVDYPPNYTVEQPVQQVVNIAKPGQINVARPSINHIAPVVDYAPGYGDELPVQQTIQTKKPGPISVYRPHVNTVAPEVEYAPEYDLGMAVNQNIPIKQAGKIGVNRPTINTTPVSVGYAPGYEQPTVLNPQLNISPAGPVTVNKPTIQAKPPAVIAGKVGDTTMMIEEPESRPFPKMIPQNEMLSEIVSDIVNGNDFEAKIKSTMTGLLAPYSQKLDAIEGHLKNIATNKGMFDKSIQPLKDLLLNLRTAGNENTRRLERKIENAISRSGSQVGLETAIKNLELKFPDFSPLTQATQASNALMQQVVVQNQLLTQGTQLLREEMNQHVKAFTDFMNGSLDTFRELKTRLENDQSKEIVNNLVAMNGKLLNILDHLGGHTGSPLYKTIQSMIQEQQQKLDNHLIGKDVIKSSVEKSRASRRTAAISRMRQKATISQLNSEINKVKTQILAGSENMSLEGITTGDIKETLSDLMYQRQELIKKLNLDFLKTQVPETPRVFMVGDNKIDTGVEAVSNSLKALEQKVGTSGPPTKKQKTEIFTLQGIIEEVNKATGGALKTPGGGQQLKPPTDWMDLFQQVEQDFSARVRGYRDNAQIFENNASDQDIAKTKQAMMREWEAIERDMVDIRNEPDSPEKKAKLKNAAAAVKALKSDFNQLDRTMANIYENESSEFVAKYTSSKRYEENMRAYTRFAEDVSPIIKQYADTPNSPEFGVALAEIMHKYKNVLDPRFMESLATKMNTTQGVNWEAEFQKYQSGKHRARADAGKNWENSANKLLQEQEGKKKTGKLGRSSRSQRSDASIKYAGEHFFPDLEFRELGFNSQEEMTAFVNGVVDSLRKEQPGLTDPNAFREEAARMLAVTIRNNKARESNDKFLQSLRELGSGMVLKGDNSVDPEALEEFLMAFQSFKKPDPNSETELRANMQLSQAYWTMRNTNSAQRIYEMAKGVRKDIRTKDLPPIETVLGEFADLYSEINLANTFLGNIEKAIGGDPAGGKLVELKKAQSTMIGIMQQFLLQGNNAMYQIAAATQGAESTQIRVVSQQILIQAVKFFESLGNTEYASMSSDILEAIDMYNADVGEEVAQGMIATLPDKIQQETLQLISGMPVMYKAVVDFMTKNNLSPSIIPKFFEPSRNLEDLTKQDTSGMAGILSGDIKMEDEEF